MNAQEKLFADEFVFCYFNSEEKSWSNLGVKAATHAGYEMPNEDKLKAEQEAKEIFNKVEIKNYIESEISTLKAKLQPEQRRHIWKEIQATALGEPGEWDNYGVIRP